MPAIKLRFPTILFDWGDTVMYDDPSSMMPMVEWEAVQVVEGIHELLTYLHAGGRRIVLATGASISDEEQIRGALKRGGLDTYFAHIYCFKNTRLSKGEAFYRHILNDLGLTSEAALMVGDGFEKDVQQANRAGIFAVWFNPRSKEKCSSDLHFTVHSLQELREFFNSLDRE